MRFNKTSAALCRCEGQYRAVVLNSGRRRARKAAGPIILNVVPPPIAEAPHDTGVSGFMDASTDTDRRDSVQSIERARIGTLEAYASRDRPVKLKDFALWNN